MDEKVWQAYEQQHRELRKKYRWLRWRIFLVWLGYYVASTAALAVFIYPWRLEVAVGGIAINTLISVFLMLFAINGRLKEEQSQHQALIEKAPVGRLQL